MAAQGILSEIAWLQASGHELISPCSSIVPMNFGRYISRVKNLRWLDLLYLLPVFHLYVCIISAVMDWTDGIHYLEIADLLFSMLLAPFAWVLDDHFFFWFSTAGTLWWLVLSHTIHGIFDRNWFQDSCR